MKDSSNQIWAYIHNELPPDKKEHFEQVLQSDPLLREALQACRQTHRELESVLPMLDEEVDDTQLEKQLLDEWEAAHPEHAETPTHKPHRKIIYLSAPLAAAAAATFLLLALPQKPIHWQRTAYGTAPQLRGQSNAESHYTRTELKQINRELQIGIETHLKQRPESSKPLKLKIHIQELLNGALVVEISEHPEESNVWNQSFQNLEIFRTEIPRFGKRIADELADRNTP